ncbi:MAG: hypothetical protein QY318_01205 [Candidatus Dojkabacteria bacterium]|nr:MAG: hypothetical protein QY318_01205 [Candidatus Dojkabacteria bacterium]
MADSAEILKNPSYGVLDGARAAGEEGGRLLTYLFGGNEPIIRYAGRLEEFVWQLEDVCMCVQFRWSDDNSREIAVRPGLQSFVLAMLTCEVADDGLVGLYIPDADTDTDRVAPEFDFMTVQVVDFQRMLRDKDSIGGLLNEMESMSEYHNDLVRSIRMKLANVLGR